MNEIRNYRIFLYVKVPLQFRENFDNIQLFEIEWRKEGGCFLATRRRNKNEAYENMPVVVNRTRALFSFFALHLVCTVSVNNSGRHRFYIPTGCINQVRRKPRCVVFAPTRNFSNFSNPLDSLWTAENGWISRIRNKCERLSKKYWLRRIVLWNFIPIE